ncbi:MAG TPA: hypothetical protein EYH13_05225 [Thermococcus paralvinellae]|uniref:Uncharacterized protein n=1 Tax=Thermococcus paralvinellae TaxID=582419 RepID=A0A832ZAG0_9EURY|nr:hypothetical protein [Thermococcus paralvinellae]
MINVCRFVVFIGLLSGLMYMRIDHIYRSGVALIGLLIPDILQKKLNPSEKLKPFLSPLYNDKIITILAIFIAIHVSLVNVPFTTIDLFHKEWTNADMISHFLGGLTVWVMVAHVLNELSRKHPMDSKQVVVYSFLILLVVSIGWEVAEKLSESEISFIHETFANKLRDLVMNTLGALSGLWLVKTKKYPFELN